MWGMVPFVKQGGINFELLASYHIIPYMSLITSYNYLNYSQIQKHGGINFDELDSF